MILTPATPNLPQFPVDKQVEDKITVKLAANDSGMVTFDLMVIDP